MEDRERGHGHPPALRRMGCGHTLRATAGVAELVYAQDLKSYFIHANLLIIKGIKQEEAFVYSLYILYTRYFFDIDWNNADVVELVYTRDLMKLSASTET